MKSIDFVNKKEVNYVTDEQFLVHDFYLSKMLDK